MSSIGERIMMVRGRESREKFAARVDISAATLKRYENENYPIPERFLRVFAAEMGLSLEWLLTGNGEMYAQIPEKMTDQNEYQQNEILAALREQIETQRRHIAALEQNTELAKLATDALQRENEALRGQLELTKRQVEMLEELLSEERQKTPQNTVDRIQAAG